MFFVFGLISLCLSYPISALIKGMFLIIGFLCGKSWRDKRACRKQLLVQGNLIWISLISLELIPRHIYKMGDNWLKDPKLMCS